MSRHIQASTRRLFAGVIGIVFAAPSGIVLYHRYTHLGAAFRQEWVSRMFFGSLYEIVALIFIISFCSILWALFTPAWVERLFHSDLVLFVCMMSSIVIVVTGIIICIRHLAS